MLCSTIELHFFVKELDSNQYQACQIYLQNKVKNMYTRLFFKKKHDIKKHKELSKYKTFLKSDC